MQNFTNIRPGTQVYTEDGQMLGTVEDVRGNELFVNGQRYPASAFSRYENNRLYTAGNRQNAASGTVQVPVAEEQLRVGKRDVQAGEVDLQKRIVNEQVNVPVDLRREEVRVEQRDLPDRPLRAGEADTLFREGTIRVPVTAEEAVVSKEAYVTGEVVVNKEATTQRQDISDTVRREQVEVADNRQTATGGVVRDQGYTRQPATTGYDTAQTTGYDTATAGAVRPATNDLTSAGAYASAGGRQLQTGMEVFGSDQESIGQVKEVRDQDFLIDRPMARDVYAPYSAVQTATNSQVVLNIPAGEVSGQGWANPNL